MYRKTSIAIALLISQSALLHAEKNIDLAPTYYAALEQTTIIGSKEKAASLPGSAYVLDHEDLETFNYNDINSMLRDVPGVYLRQEEGYGLRPNIGIRGAVGERNNKITVMEDGILIAPAPYSGPAAYYFPTAGRIYSMEIAKGPATIANGPFTVGGAINLISTPIPQEDSGKLNLEVGEHGEQRLHFSAGMRTEQTGLNVETYQQSADGFQTIDNAANNTGFEKHDYIVKGQWNTADTTATYQQLNLRLSYADENSDQTYLGLSDADFTANPDRRYGLTQLDNMDNEHRSAVFSHLVRFTDNVSLSTDIYRNEFKRDWYKVNTIDGNKLTAMINDANANDATAINILHGNIAADINIKHNAREYLSQGVQTTLNWQFDTGSISHDLKTGLRLHEDEVERFQPTDDYQQMIGGALVYQNTNLPGAKNNRIQEAQAFSAYILDTMMLSDNLDITLGLRLEDYDTKETRYELDGTGTVKAQNSVNEILPALGATYQVHENVQLLAGYTKGFAVTEAGDENVEPELSDNVELGGRFIRDNLQIDLIAFYADYGNAAQNCTVSNPCDNGDESGSVSFGSSQVKGLEFLTNYNHPLTNNLSIPMNLSYTYTQTQITQDSDNANKGDILANVPENILSTSIGLSAARWDTFLKAAYTDSLCPNTSCERTDGTAAAKTDDLLVFDWVGSYMINADLRTYIRVENLADERAIIARQPAGARGNKPRTAYVGMNWTF